MTLKPAQLVFAASPYHRYHAAMAQTHDKGAQCFIVATDNYLRKLRPIGLALCSTRGFHAAIGSHPRTRIVAPNITQNGFVRACIAVLNLQVFMQFLYVYRAIAFRAGFDPMANHFGILICLLGFVVPSVNCSLFFTLQMIADGSFAYAKGGGDFCLLNVFFAKYSQCHN